MTIKCLLTVVTFYPLSNSVQHTGLSVSWVVTQQKNMALNQRQHIVKMLDKMGNSHREIHTSNETRRSGLFNGIKNMRSKLLISMRKWHFNFQNITVNYAHGISISFLVWNVLSSFPKVFCKFQMPQMPRSIEIRFFAGGVNAVLFCLLYARSTGKHRWANLDFKKLQILSMWAIVGSEIFRKAF